jgi:glycerate-2-kinase
VDAATIERGRKAGRDAAASLADNDAGTFLESSGDAVVTGPTNTNLLDLYLILRP